MNPASLGDPETEALPLDGRWMVSEAEPLPLLEDRLTGLAAEGGEWDTGMHMDLLC